MVRNVSLAIAMLLVVSTLQAQEGGPPSRMTPPPAQAGKQAQPEPKPTSEKKFRWLARALKLDAKQMQQVEALIAVYNTELEEQKNEPQALLMKIQDKYTEIQAAQQKNDTELVKKLNAELKNLAPGVLPEKHFYEGLEEILTPQQKEQLPDLRKRADAATDLTMRPVQVVRAALKTKPTPEQRKKLDTISETFRNDMVANRPDSPEAQTQRLDKLVEEVRAVLTPEQVKLYDQEIAALRDLAVPPTRFEAPSTQPAAEPAAKG